MRSCEAVMSASESHRLDALHEMPIYVQKLVQLWSQYDLQRWTVLYNFVDKTVLYYYGPIRLLYSTVHSVFYKILMIRSTSQ